MAASETELEMVVRHVAEQEGRIARQKALIERLREIGLPTDDAFFLLRDMRTLFETMCDHVKRISKKP